MTRTLTETLDARYKQPVAATRFDARYDQPVAATRAAFERTAGVVIISGGVGTGKTTVIADTLRDVPEQNIARVRGSRFGSATAYFALAHLLGDDVQLDSTVVVAGALLQEKLAQIGDAGVVIAVTNWELLDSASASVLVDALATGRYRALIGCLDADADGDLLALINAQIATVVEFPTLTSEQIGQTMALRCGGVVSREVSDSILETTAGDPLLVKFTIELGTQQGWYVLRSGAWVRGHNSEWNPNVGLPRAHSLLASVTEDENALLELLATFGSVPTALIVDLYRMESISTLESRGLITPIDRGRAYRIASPIFAQIIRTAMTEGRFRAVWDLYIDLIDQPGHRNEPRQLLRVAQAGVELSPAVILAAARLASDRRDHWLSDTLLELLDDSGAVLMTRATNASMRGDSAAAISLLASARERAVTVRERADAIGIAFATHLLHRFDLRAARSELLLVKDFPDEPGSSRYELVELGRYLELAYLGAYSELAADYESGLQPGMHPAAGRLLSRIYAEALAVRGDARRAAQVIALSLDSPLVAGEEWLSEISAGTRRRVLFLAGEWAAALELAQASPVEGDTTSPLQHGFGTLFEAGIAVFRGDDPGTALTTAAAHLDGLTTLAPGTRDALLIAVGGSTDSDPVAALRGAVRILETCLLPRDEVRMPILVAALRIADLVEPESALDMLMEYVERARSGGAAGVALVYAAICLRVLVRSVVAAPLRDEVLDLVLTTEAENTGEFALVVHTLAQSLTSDTQSGRGMVDDLCAALGLGTLLVPAPGEAEDAPNLSVLPELESGYLTSVSAVETRTDSEPEVDRTDEEIDALERIEALSGRELGVYRALLNGETNAAIAEHFGVTQRTAEGHVQRLYRLLGVNSRRALLDRYPRSLTEHLLETR